MAATYYLTSDFYQNDIQRVITLDTPHTGFDLAVYMNKIYSLENLGKGGFTNDTDNFLKKYNDIMKKSIQERIFGSVSKGIGDNIGGRIGSLFQAPTINDVYRDSTNWVIAAESWKAIKMLDVGQGELKATFDLTCVPLLSSSVLELLRLAVFAGEGLSQMHPESDFMRNLKNADIKSGSDSTDFRLVSARGAPTPHKDYINRYYLTTPYIAQQLIPWTPEYQAIPNKSQKYWSLMFSMLFPGIFTVKDGSIAVSVDSSRGEGVKLFEKYDTKRYDVSFKSKEFENAMDVVDGIYDACLAAYIMASLFGAGPSADIFFLPPKITLTFYSLTLIPEDWFIEKGTDSGLKLHLVIPSVVTQKESDGTSIIDKTLDNIALVGGNLSTVETKSGVRAFSITTSGYTAPDQAFVLLSDLDSKNQPTGVYHTVTIEAVNYGNESRDQLFPVNIDGQKMWVYSVTVKEYPTAMKAVVNTYLPKKLKRFNYSENFAAWKPVGEVDEWGNFTLKGLKLAEGQNVLSYDIETWTGLVSNKQIRVICNSIPLVASEFSPIPGIYTNNNRQTFKGKFGKAAYSSDPLEDIALRSAKLVWGSNEADVTSKVKVTVNGGAHDKYLWYDFTPDEPLPDGYYTFIISVNSNIGASQAAVDFTIDTQAPVITMEALKPYSPRSPTVIRYSSYDELSPNILSVRCDLYDASSNLITNIATADSLSKGDNYFTFDTSKLDVSVPDNNYKIRIKAFDLANNYTVAEQPIIIDSTPPTVAGVDINPNPMTSKATELGFAARVNEKSTVIIKLNNTSNNSITAYLTQATAAADGGSYTASYVWKYDDALAKGPEDGIYRVEVVAMDEAGNESEPRTLEAIRIDRTPPKIYGQITNPYVLSNIGKDAYKTTLSYNLSDASSVKIKIYNSNTGQLVDSIPAAPASNSSVNNVPWNGSGQPKGAYRFQIIAEDDIGNIGIAYASCVKDGIAPVISYPADDNAEVAGTISIRGTAIDPDWTNDKPFKCYRAYYTKGTPSIPGNLDALSSEWQHTFIEVPQINRDPKDPKNISVRPLQNNSTLAYLYTNNLENSDYTVMVVVDEENGESLATARVIKVNNNLATATAVQSPYIKLRSLPDKVEFKSDDSVKLPLGFTNSVKSANVYIEVIKIGSVEAPVYFKYFSNILGAPFIGKPDYKPGTDLGYFIWSDDDGYHLRWSADGSNHKFTGSVILVGGGAYSEVKQTGSGIKVQSSLISWDTSLRGGEGGIDFKVSSGQIMITAKIDEDPTSPSITANNVYLGISKYTQQYLPIIIDVSGQRLVDVTKMGKPAESSNLERSTQTIEWNGKLDTGAYVDNGIYVVRVRAEGADGIGVSTDESMVEVKTPFELTNVKVDPADRKFSTIGGINCITVSYNVSKDSIVTAIVQKQNGEYLSTLAEGKEVLGATNPNYPLSIIWRGNFPDSDSGTVVTGGTHKIKLNVTAKDGSGNENIDIDNVSITEFTLNDKVVSLDPIGDEVNYDNGNGLEQIHLASGDSPYYFEAIGIGKYHPPKDFSYTLTANGSQRITAYPYVPFAALMHRYFHEVDTKVKVTFKIHGWNHYLGAEDNWLFGKWWNPLKWRREHEERVETVWLEKDNLPGVSSKGVIFKQGDESKSYQFEFDTNTWWHQNEWDWQWGKPNPGSGIDSIDTYVELYAKDGSFILDNTFSDLLPNSGVARTFKGVFKAENVGTPYSTSYLTRLLDGSERYRSYGAYRVNLDLALDTPIVHSRLTNRFVPWFGFVRAGVPVNEKSNFSGYLNDLDKLGFPGKNYFDKTAIDKAAALSKITLLGTSTTIPTAPHEGSFSVALFPGNTSSLVAQSSDNYPVPKVNDITTESSSNMIGSASDYTSYLSDEHLEFIPITSPYGGNFEYNGSAVGETFSLEKKDSYPIVAKTSLVYPYKAAAIDGGSIISSFVFSWPWNQSEKDTFDRTMAVKRATLDKEQNGNPQNYTGPTWNREANTGGTWWDLDEGQIIERKNNQNNSKIGSGQTRYVKSVLKSTWSTIESFDQFLPVPSFVDNPRYTSVSNTTGITVYPSSGGPRNKLSADDNDRAGVDWTTANDTNLLSSDGLIRSRQLIFNRTDFKGKRTLYVSSGKEEEGLKRIESFAYQLNDRDYTSANALKYTFLTYDPFGRDGINTPIDNPSVVITDWQVTVRDKTGGQNRDLSLEKVTLNGKRLDDTFTLKLKLDASEARYVEILGKASGPYELMYFDGKTWKTIYQSNEEKTGRLAWWNVSRLNGKYTVLLRTLSGNFISTQDVQIGILVEKGGGDAYSTYKRAQLKFPGGAFVNGSKLPQDQIVTITPVAINEIYIRNRPIIITSGPIVEIKPSPWKFTVSSIEAVDQRPTLKFVYTFDDLAELDVDTSKVTGIKGDVAPELMLPWNIHQVTSAGDLQIISDNHQTVEDYGDEKHYVFYAALDHFSTYALLPGKFSLSAPIVLADRYITNKNTVTIYGTAEPGSVLTLYLKSENVPPEVEKSEPYFTRISAKAATGNYKFENVGPLREGENYIFVTSHLGDEKGIRTYSDVTIVKDTVPPSAEARPNLYAFSPNGDGKYDSVDFVLKSNEKGKLCLQLTANSSPFFNQDISAEVEKDIKLTWTKEGFDLYRRDPGSGSWSLVSGFPLSEKLSDGTYQWTVYAIDEAGNISNNIISQTVIDTTPPTVQGLNADPNPFTPNDDGIKDTTKFWYKFSEPAYTSLSIYRDDGKLFRTHEGPTENFTYPTLVLSAYSLVPSAGGWEWEGRGSRNELLGGTYTWSIWAEDWVGNSTSSEVKQIVVDREPTLIPYAYAEPDPFAPVNPSNSFTEIKYYLSRDNLKVGVSVIGNEGKIIKTLAANEILGKGEHSVRWYGDFNADYEGPTASKNKYRVSDSSYEFKIRAEDLGEAGAKPAEVSNTVLVDNVSPNILIKDLAVDYVKKQASLLYSIPESSSVEVSVLDSESRVLSVLITDEAQAAGEHTVNYPLAGREGQNYFKIVATDRARNTAEKTSSAFAVNPDQFRLASHTANPSTFTPNGDGLIDITRISYQLAGGVPEYRVWIDIRTQSGSTVKRLVVNDPQDRGTYSFYWDGKNDAGQMAPDGYYEYVISAEDRLGARVEGRGELLMVSARPTVDLSTSLPIFSPNGDGASDRVMFNYSINYATFFISGEALVRIDVLNSSGEAVWSKTFNRTAGSYAYEYDGTDSSGAPLPAGDYYVKIFGQDALWSTAVPKTIALRVDYTQPEPSDFSIDPAYAKLDANVSIKLSFAEPLADIPAVRLTLSDGTTRSLSVTPSETASYECSYVVGNEDPEGTVIVSIEARDLALNPINRTKTFVIDKTSPEVSGLSASPNPASIPSVNGQVSIKFNVSEPLKELPKVYVAQNGAPPSLTYGSQLTANSFEYKYDAFSGYDGSALITIEVTDLANNLQLTANSFEVDTIKPVISNIRSEIGGNPEFTKFAKEGSEVTIRFNVSESLKFNPELKINGNVASYDSLNLGEYAYKYTVTGADTEGNAAITISGLDYALNEGTAETSSSSESFVIDLVNPTVTIAETSDLIANPGNFSTNANPDETDRPRSTRMFYSPAEYSKITVKVHKVGNTQVSYSKVDFNDGNLIATLVNNVWQNAREQEVVWYGTIEANGSIYDVNGDGYADPGKYAFIVEGRDRAGNLTLKKWGGTVWIQDNVLTLREPEQFEYRAASLEVTNNPDPHYTSPNGNSAAPSQKRARFYFIIPCTPEPQVVNLPERIEAQTVAGAYTKKVGKYSVRVYSNSGLTDLVRTITTESDAWSTSLMYEDWNGKNDAGQFVDNGTYYMVVDVKDYAGNPANDNLLKRSVVVDNTAPTVSNHSVSNYYFCAGMTTDNTDPTRRTSTISYEVGDNGSRVKTSIDISRAGAHKATLQNITSQDANAVYTKLWSNEGYDVDGTYTYRITTVDQAGNTASAEGQAVMDKTAPVGNIQTNSNATYTISPSVTLNLTNSDVTSGMDKMSFSNDNSVWTAWENPSSTKAWTLPGADGAKSVYVKYVDRAGNYLSANDSIVLDTVNPYFATGPTVNPAHTPVGSWSTHVDPYLSFTASDATSGVRDLHGYIDGADQGAMPYYTTSWHPNVSDGTHNLKLRINDNAGRYTDSSTYTFLIDTTPPNAPSVSVSHTPVGSWSNHNSPYFIWSDPGDGNGSGVSYYRGFVDGADQGTVSSGWHPTLAEGTHMVYVRAVDGVGLDRNSSTLTFYIDTQVPSISQPGERTFNPYVDGSVRIDFTATDPSPSSGFSVSNISARIKYGSNTVKNLSVYDDGGGNYHVIWDGMNNSSDYENEGDYSLEISASDAVGNPAETKTSTVSLIDDQYIGQGYNPSLSISGGNLTLNWLLGWDDSERQMVEAYGGDDDWGSDYFGPWGDMYYVDKEYFTLDYPQILETSSTAINEWAPSEYHAIKRASDDTVMWEKDFTGNDDGSTHYFTDLLPAGRYYAYVYINDEYNGGAMTYAFTKVWYYNRRYNQYARTSSDLGRNWGGTSDPVLVDSCPSGPSVYPNYTPVINRDPNYRPYPIGSVCHGIRVGDGLYYKRGSITDYIVTSYYIPLFYEITPVISWSNEVKISRVGDQPSITADTSGNAYVAWLVRVGLNQQIDFQKIPVNFARITGTVQGAATKVDSKPLVATQSATLELPTLIAPADGAALDIRRPTFEWKAPKTAYKDYKVLWAKGGRFGSLDLNDKGESPLRQESIHGTTKGDDPTHVYFGYTISYIDPALEQFTPSNPTEYSWKVTAASTTDGTSVESQVRTFRCEPDLEMTGITNWPNPFNPNREETNIRYKLSRDADEVKIRIYDITGALVVDLDGDTQGEGTSMLTKYHDVRWNGRNGRGDIVMNGIYPFEIVARLGDKSVSGRGKIAVLK